MAQPEMTILRSAWLLALFAVLAPSQPAGNDLLEQVRAKALSYTASLPNYICHKTTTRRMDPGVTGKWRVSDVLVEQLSFFEQREKYKVLSINGAAARRDMGHDQLPGAKSTG